MSNINETGSGRTPAHWIGVILGTVAGLPLFVLGMRGLFTVGAHDTWLTITTGTAALLALLPLSILAIFKPRVAAYGIVLSWIVALVGFLVLAVSSPEKMEFSPPRFGLFLLYYALLPCTVAGFLFYCSVRNPPPHEHSNERRLKKTLLEKGAPASGQWLSKVLIAFRLADRKRKAQVVAVLLGLIVGGYGISIGSSLAARFVRQGNWVAVVGICAGAMALAPLSILGVFKPRAAAYGVLASLLVVAAYLVAVSGRSAFGLGDILGEALFLLWFGLPPALVAILLLYASSDRHGQA